MPHLNIVNVSEIKFALLFQHTTEKQFWEAKTAFNERMEHSQ